MMPHPLLLLLGGSAVFGEAAEVFVPAVGGREARIVLLLQGGSGWEEYVPEYTRPWMQRGASRFYPIVPNEGGQVDLDQVSAELEQATGIFIGGGHTPTYHRLYATEPVRGMIRERYRQGVPVAGMSAGALLAPEICVLTPDETDDASFAILDGLGLIDDVIVSVHFTEWNALPSLLDGMAETETGIGWGIDESACAVFEGGQFSRTLGQAVYEIVMTDFATKSYTMVRLAARAAGQR